MASAGGHVGLDLYTKAMTLRMGANRLEVVERGHTETFQTDSNPYLEEDRIFVDAVESGDPSGIRSSYPDAIGSLRASLAANRSIEEGRSIEC
jgi:hypothetical protein